MYKKKKIKKNDQELETHIKILQAKIYASKNEGLKKGKKGKGEETMKVN